MSQPDLILRKSDYEGEIGSYLGWGRGPDNGEEEWDESEQRDIASLLKSAQNQVYCLTQLNPPNGPIHQWSFLTVSGSAGLSSGARSAELPEDFGFLVGEVTMEDGTGSAFWEVRLENIDRLRALFARNLNQTGRPQWVAMDERRGTTAVRSSRGVLAVYPAADADYVLRFTYSVIPQLISDKTPFCYGGAAHSETFKAACRAKAELYRDNSNINGPENTNFRACLAASVAYDRRRKPHQMSYNGDWSDALDGVPYRDRHWWGHLTMPTSTIGGTDPG